MNWQDARGVTERGGLVTAGARIGKRAHYLLHSLELGTSGIRPSRLHLELPTVVFQHGPQLALHTPQTLVLVRALRPQLLYLSLEPRALGLVLRPQARHLSLGSLAELLDAALQRADDVVQVQPDALEPDISGRLRLVVARSHNYLARGVVVLQDAPPSMDEG